MSGRGGRGGGRGGRGGARGGKKGAPPGTPWDIDPSVVIPDTPQDTYPKSYNPPLASNHPFSAYETRAARYFVQFRRDFHNSSLYTHKHLAPESSKASSNISDPIAKSYGLQQANARFGVRSKATVDPFLAVPMYNHQFISEARMIPEVKGRLFNLELFPEELWTAMEGKDGMNKNGKAAGLKGTKRKLAMEPDALDDDEDDDFLSRKRPETEEERKRRIERALQGKEDDDAAEEEADDDEAEMTQEDDDFEDDEDGGDYNAEQYFDDGAEGEFEDEGGGESAMDF